MADYNDSHASQPSKGHESPPIPQRKRNALGERVNGMSNPYGAARPSTEDKCNGKNY